VTGAIPLLGTPEAALAPLLGGRTRARAALAWALLRDGLPVDVPEAIPGVARQAWDAVRARVTLPSARVVGRRAATDGTIKYAIELGGPRDVVETVLIPGPRRSTICVSSQIGCTRRCGFCATATLGFRRALDAAEIVAQVQIARREAPADAPARNVVFMGMGEPMDNLDAVLPAIDVLLGPGSRLRARYVTVSTSGVLPGIERFLAASPANLALSVNATTEETRRSLMPHDRRWPLEDLLALLRADHVAHPGRIHFIEYVLLHGVNDTDADAERLVALLDGIPVRVNLIPHNELEGIPFRAPPAARVKAFQDRVFAGGVRVIVRRPRGQDIDAACGQLALRVRPDPAPTA